MSGTLIEMPFVRSVSRMFVYATDAVWSVCPFGHEKSDGSGGGLSVNEAVTLPFLPELKVPVALTGPDTGCLV
jgi:hypothetical protein